MSPSESRKRVQYIPSFPILVQNDKALVIGESVRIEICFNDKGRRAVLCGITRSPSSQVLPDDVSVIELDVELDRDIISPEPNAFN